MIRPAEAFVTVWAKGFRVSEDNDEFQRVLPVKASETSFSLEDELCRPRVWVPILDPLYGLSAYDLSTQRCILLRPQEIGVISIGRSEDKHGRPSLVVVLAAMRIDWRDPELGAQVSRAAHLSGRLAEHFAATFRRSPAEVLAQLRLSSFLSDRRYDLSEEPPGSVIDGSGIIATVRQWRGVQGVATPRFVGLGANVLLGTRDEAERSAVKLDGFIDRKNFEMVPITSALNRWSSPVLDSEPLPSAPDVAIAVPPEPSMQEQRLASIDNTLKQLSGSVQRLANAGDALLATVNDLSSYFRWWLHGAKRK